MCSSRASSRSCPRVAGCRSSTRCFRTTRSGDVPGKDGPALVIRLEPHWSPQSYAARFERVRDYIAAGDVYQISLTFPLNGELKGDPLALYGP